MCLGLSPSLAYRALAPTLPRWCSHAGWLSRGKGAGEEAQLKHRRLKRLELPEVMWTNTHAQPSREWDASQLPSTQLLLPPNPNPNANAGQIPQLDRSAAPNVLALECGMEHVRKPAHNSRRKGTLPGPHALLTSPG